MAEVVGEAERLGQIRVETERAGEGAADLGDFETVGEADAEMIAVGRDEDLGLVTQAAERNGVDDAVVVALDGIARAERAAAVLGMEAAKVGGWVGSAGRESIGSVSGREIVGQEG